MIFVLIAAITFIELMVMVVFVFKSRKKDKYTKVLLQTNNI